MNNLQFMATLKIEKIYKISAFLIIDHSEGVIQNISSGCINVIGLDEKKLLKGDIKIGDIVNFLINKNKISFNLNKDSLFFRKYQRNKYKNRHIS